MAAATGKIIVVKSAAAAPLELEVSSLSEPNRQDAPSPDVQKWRPRVCAVQPSPLVVITLICVIHLYNLFGDISFLVSFPSLPLVDQQYRLTIVGTNKVPMTFCQSPTCGTMWRYQSTSPQAGPDPTCYANASHAAFSVDVLRVLESTLPKELSSLISIMDQREVLYNGVLAQEDNFCPLSIGVWPDNSYSLSSSQTMCCTTSWSGCCTLQQQGAFIMQNYTVGYKYVFQWASSWLSDHRMDIQGTIFDTRNPLLPCPIGKLRKFLPTWNEALEPYKYEVLTRDLFPERFLSYKINDYKRIFLYGGLGFRVSSLLLFQIFLLVVILGKEIIKAAGIWSYFFHPYFHKPDRFQFLLNSPLIPVTIWLNPRFRQMVQKSYAIRKSTPWPLLWDFLFQDIPQLFLPMFLLVLDYSQGRAGALTLVSLSGSILSILITAITLYRQLSVENKKVMGIAEGDDQEEGATVVEHTVSIIPDHSVHGINNNKELEGKVVALEGKVVALETQVGELKGVLMQMAAVYLVKT